MQTGDGYGHVAYAEAFPQEVGAILVELDNWITGKRRALSFCTPRPLGHVIHLARMLDLGSIPVKQEAVPSGQWSSFLISSLAVFCCGSCPATGNANKNVLHFLPLRCSFDRRGHRPPASQAAVLGVSASDAVGLLCGFTRQHAAATPGFLGSAHCLQATSLTAVGREYGHAAEHALFRHPAIVCPV